MVPIRVPTRGITMPFKKGTSGNPGGRPKVVGEVQTLARQHSTEAINTLREIMRDKKAPPAARGYAANSLLDRGYGKPSQTITSGGKDGALDQMTDAELLAVIASEPPGKDPESEQTQH